MPSMPGAPLFWRTCFNARCRLVRSSTHASNVSGEIGSGVGLDPAAGSSCGVAAACCRRWSDAVQSLFTPVLRLSLFRPSAPALRLLCLLLSSHGRSMLVARHSAPAALAGAPVRSPEVRHVTVAARAPDLQSASSFADGGLRGYVPARPECTTPTIRFLFIAPQLWVRLPSDPTSR